MTYVKSRRMQTSRSSEPRLGRRSRTEGALPFNAAVPMGVGVADVDAIESLSASIPARLINVDPEGFRNVPLIVDAMLPRCVPSELRGLDPRPVKTKIHRGRNRIQLLSCNSFDCTCKC